MRRPKTDLDLRIAGIESQVRVLRAELRGLRSQRELRNVVPEKKLRSFRQRLRYAVTNMSGPQRAKFRAFVAAGFLPAAAVKFLTGEDL